MVDKNNQDNAREVTLGNWKFTRMDITDKRMYERYIKETEYPTNLWSSNFDFVWGSAHPDEETVLWRDVDGMIAIFKLTRKKRLQLAFLPLGRGDSDKLVRVLDQCLQFCYEWNRQDKKTTYVRVINHLQLKFLKQSSLFGEQYKTVQLLGMDRHISVPDLLQLSGKRFDSLRSKMNKFIREYPGVHFRHALPTDADALFQLKEEWNLKAGIKYKRVWDDLFYQRMVENHQELGHIILLAEMNGHIMGMTSGGIAPHGQAWAALLKQAGTERGLAEALSIELIKEIHHIEPRTELINLGNDQGPDSGLRTFKDKFRPVLDVKRYRLQLK